LGNPGSQQQLSFADCFSISVMIGILQLIFVWFVTYLPAPVIFMYCGRISDILPSCA
jgi:hypothetical protein